MPVLNGTDNNMRGKDMIRCNNQNCFINYFFGVKSMKNIYLAFFVMILMFIGCEKNTIENKTNGDGMLLINGQRTFIIGSYHLPKTETPFVTLKENGFYYVHVSPDKKQLDQAQKNGLRVWIGTGVIREDHAQEDRARIKKTVEVYKDHPALLCWEIADEPAFTWKSAKMRIKPKAMIETYNLIKSIDKKHLIYTNHGPVNLISTLKKYNPATDITSVDVYPVIPHGITPTYALYDDGLQGDLLNSYISQVGEYMEKMRKVAGPGRPVFAVLQGFAWEALKKEQERNPKMILYPTLAESRFMAYDAIVHGAVGINYWGMSYSPQPGKFIDNLYKVTRELSQMQVVLSARKYDLKIDKAYHELGYSVDTGIEILAKRVDGKIYLLTVNSDKNPVKVTLKGLPQKLKSAQVLQENRKVDIVNGELTDSYKAFDTHIYKLQ